jgi:hypothetical protein
MRKHRGEKGKPHELVPRAAVANETRQEFPARLFRKHAFIFAWGSCCQHQRATTKEQEPTMATSFRALSRRSSTTRSGAAFDQRTITAVWNRATIVPGVNPDVRRKDVCGAWIDRSQYGTTSENGTGWEIDHIVPVSYDGTDELVNLQPLQWQNNRRKGDAYSTAPSYYTAVTAAT